MEILGLGLTFEQMPVGRQFRTIGRTVTETDLINYINAVGLTEVLFTNAVYRAEESAIQGRMIPGMMAQGLAEGILATSTMQHTGLALLEMHVKIEGPCCVGDTIHAEVEILEARRSASKPDRGIVRSRNRVVRHDGVAILTYTTLRMIKCAKSEG